MTAALAHTGPNTARIVWDNNQYRLLYAEIFNQRSSGDSMIDIVTAAMKKVIPEKYHRTITSTVALQVWAKAQKSVGIHSQPAQPAAPLATTPAASMPVVLAGKSTMELFLTRETAKLNIDKLPIGTKITLVQ